MGVFVPCLQNILGIIFYIRFSWYPLLNDIPLLFYQQILDYLLQFKPYIGTFRLCRIVGIAGVWHSLILVCLCCTCTFLTGISLSAIATNGAMKVILKVCPYQVPLLKSSPELHNICIYFFRVCFGSQCIQLSDVSRQQICQIVLLHNPYSRLSYNVAWPIHEQIARRLCFGNQCV